VLVEARSKDGRLMGRTPQFKIVHFEGEDRLIGRIVPVEILARPNACRSRSKNRDSAPLSSRYERASSIRKRFIDRQFRGSYILNARAVWKSR
jgi:hypothetical protein